MKIIQKILDNDMHIILIPLNNTPLVTMGFFVGAGSRNENNNNSGIAHFLEHMMFKGTLNRTATQMFSELDVMGAVYNAATSDQYTYYYVYGNSSETKKMLDILLDIYINPKFEDKEINKEKKVIIEEMRLQLDSSISKLNTMMHKKFFKGTSLEREIIGTFETVTNLKKKDLNEFRSSLYNPENTVFVMAGNFTPEPMYKIIKNILKPVKNSKIPVEPYLNERDIILKNMSNQKQPYVHIKKNDSLQQVYMFLAFPLYDYYSYKNLEIELLSQLLSAGSSSRLSKELREKHGISYTLTTFPLVYYDVGVFVIQIILNPTELIKGIQIILKELKKIKQTLMSDEELEKIINVTKNETIYLLSNPLSVFKMCGISYLADRNYKLNIKKDFAELEKITKEQIRDIAKKIFVWKKINLFLYGNVTEEKYDFMNL